MADKLNAVVYIMGGSYKVFTKYPTGMPTTEAQAKALVANWKAINPANRFAKYVIIEDVVNAATEKAQALKDKGVPENNAINTAVSDTTSQITAPTPKSILPWVIGGAAGLIAVITGIILIRKK